MICLVYARSGPDVFHCQLLSEIRVGLVWCVAGGHEWFVAVCALKVVRAC